MSQSEWQLQKYVTEAGVCPFDQWFATLEPQIQARVDVRLDRVSLGNFGDCKSVGQEVYELRFSFGPGYRVYYGLAGRRMVLLLVGGSKKTQGQDIKAAQRFWSDYQQERSGD
jgi:putative addiction module killer protein